MNDNLLHDMADKRLAELTGETARLASARLGGSRPTPEDFYKTMWLMMRHTNAPTEAIAEAPRFRLGSPHVELMTKAAVSAGGAATGEWGSDVADFSRLARDFIALLNDETVVGQLGCVPVPFQTKVVVESDPPVAGFVGHGAAIPMARMSLSDTTALTRLKVAVILPFSDESLQIWSPSVQANIEARMRQAVQRGLDAEFLDPDRAALAGVRPGSVLNGVSPLGLFGSTAATALTSFQTLLGSLVDNGSDLRRVSIVMHASTCLQLSLMQNSANGPAFPRLNANGGTVAGIPVLTSVSAVRSGSPSEKVVCALDASRIVLADDGDVSIQASRVAAFEMDDAPAGDSLGTPNPTNLTSAFQTGTVLLKLVRWLNYEVADSGGVAWLTANY